MKIDYRLFCLAFIALIGCNKEDVGMVDIGASAFPRSSEISSIPAPPQNKRWVLNGDTSDEFDGVALDTEKWYDCHPTWIGRVPGLFDPAMVSVEDGCLVLKAERYNTPQVVNGYTYTLGCGSVVTKKSLSYGYFESKFKTHSTSCAAGFWMSTLGSSFTVDSSNQPEGFPSGVYSQELDVCETVGREHTSADDPNGWYDFFDRFGDGMNYCAHCWYTPDSGSLSGKKLDYKIATNDALTRDDGRTPSQDFNTYAVLWDDKDRAEYFFNEKSGGVKAFTAPADDGNGIVGEQPFWFTQPMQVILNIETYLWAPVPTDEELADESLNRSYYDYFRHYVLVDVATLDVSSEVNVAPMPMFEDHIHVANKPKNVALKMVENSANEYYIELPVDYTASENKHIIYNICSVDGKVITSKRVGAYAGYGSHNVTISAQLIDRGEQYYAVAYLVDVAESDTSKAIDADSFKFKTY